MFCTRIFIFASRITPAANETEISSTSPLGSMPSNAAAEEITASSTAAFRRKNASRNIKIPKGMMSALVKRVTFLMEPSNSDCILFSFFTSLASLVA